MGEEPSTVAEKAGGRSFFKELSSAAAKKALTPLLATAATAGTTYLIRKTTEIWQEDVLPKLREKGGGKAVAKEGLEQVSGRLGGSPARVLAELAGRLGDGAPKEPSGAQRPTEKGDDTTEPREAGSTGESEAQRQEQRRQRQQRRQQRQRALQKSTST